MGDRIEEEEEADLLVRMKNDEERSYSWYKLSENNNDTLLLPCFKQMQPDCRDDSSQVAVGPFIFVIGGTGFGEGSIWNKLKRNVYYIDTRNPGDGWKKGPKLLSGRAGAYPFVLSNTIFLLGSHFIDRHPYGQVLDLKSRKWKLFKTDITSPIFPPMAIYVHGILFKDSKEEDKRCLSDSSILYDYNNVSAKSDSYPKEVYLHGFKDFYSYNFETAIFKLVDRPFNSLVYQTSVTVNDVLYVLGYDFMMGYSMSKGIWFDVSLSGFEQYKNTFPTKGSDDSWWAIPHCSLVHLGNDTLCILWASPSWPLDDVVLHCTKFTVNSAEMTQDGELPVAAVEVILNRTYKLPPGVMVDCVVVSTASAATSPFVE